MDFDYERILNWSFEDVVQSYTRKDTILYALGLGFGFNPTDPDELKFVYEEGLETFPTMPVVLGHPGPWMKNPETGIDMTKVLHGEQDLEIYKPLPTEGTIVSKIRITDVIDKGMGKGALIVIERKLYDKTTGDFFNRQSSTAFARGNGGFGGPVTTGPTPHALPDREPETTVDIPTATQTGLLYRLSGDYNLLHADPEVAKKAGFEAPILHGFATYGVAARGVLKACDINDASKLRGLSVRFSASVYPGETIRTEVWIDGNEVSFRVRVVERDVIVLNNGKAVIE